MFGKSWTLVGGQMVFLHQIERSSTEVRPTDDVDVVVDLRAEPGALRRIHQVLRDAGFSQHSPGADGVAHRYGRGAALLDVLAPDNLGAKSNLKIGGGRTIAASGSTQAIRRTSEVLVRIGNEAGPVRRPDVVGALLGKCAAVTKIVSQTTAGRLKHLGDLDALALLLGPDDRRDADLSKSERKALRRILALGELSPLAEASVDLLIQP